MIISASRRTDIPNYYSDWFFQRLREQYAYVRNPMNERQVSRIDLAPEAVDCIVFWTKNPEPMLGRLDELSGYPYYFQFTLTGYGKDIEPKVPHKRERIIPVFRELSKKLGRERVIWRYDPILFTDRYTPEYHLKAFGQIAEALGGYTEKSVISFVDVYAKNRKSMEALGCRELSESELPEFAAEIADIAGKNGIRVGSCAEKLNLEQCGIEHNACIDKELIERLTGRTLTVGRDRNQREECGCAESVDIGSYDTCGNGCRYCYANRGERRLKENLRAYDPASPMLCSSLKEGDRVTERRK